MAVVGKGQGVEDNGFAGRGMSEKGHTGWVNGAKAASDAVVRRVTSTVAGVEDAEARMWRASRDGVDEAEMLRGGSVGLFREVLGDDEGDAFADMLAGRVEHVKRTDGEVPAALRHEMARAHGDDLGRAAFLVGAIRAAAREVERSHEQIAAEASPAGRTRRRGQRDRITRELAKQGELADRIESQAAVLERIAAPYRRR